MMNLEHGDGVRIAISDGAEAAAPFYPDTKPIDAYNAAILDWIELDIDFKTCLKKCFFDDMSGKVPPVLILETSLHQNRRLPNALTLYDGLNSQPAGGSVWFIELEGK